MGTSAGAPGWHGVRPSGDASWSVSPPPLQPLVRTTLTLRRGAVEWPHLRWRLKELRFPGESCSFPRRSALLRGAGRGWRQPFPVHLSLLSGKHLQHPPVSLPGLLRLTWTWVPALCWALLAFNTQSWWSLRI